ncbi:ubiE/COQ5 methyltransferase family-domain-containing protein [Russula emetica]|nr:ubiE/COQ5 methyltransferase family-domain-containing protein [Russula emetica]
MTPCPSAPTASGRTPLFIFSVPARPIRCIDVAGGTGDIALRILDHARETRGGRETRVDIADINGEMLKEGQMRFKKTMYHNNVLREAHRLLEPGGTFARLEFNKVTNPLFAQLYDRYSFSVIPLLGTILAGDRASYQYLVESIRRFPNQGNFARMIAESGFCNRWGFRRRWWGVAGPMGWDCMCTHRCETLEVSENVRCPCFVRPAALAD